jgi:hypothetical protein
MDEILCRIYGEYYGYKSCCIDNFINTDYTERNYIKDSHIYIGTGFIPCEKCYGEIENYTFEEFKIWIGRDNIDRSVKDLRYEYIDALRITNSNIFSELCLKYNYDKTGYVEFLKEQMRRFK